MTDAQRITFNENLNKYFKLIETEEQMEENIDKIDLWGRNLYTRYCYALNGNKPTHALPEEHMEALKQKLKGNNITEEEYQEAHGKRKQLSLLIKEKRNKKLENCSIEELKKLQEECDKKINGIKQKNNSRYKTLYKLSEEDYKKQEQDLEELINKRRQINRLIERINLDQSPKCETRRTKNYNEKITELMKKNKEQEIEIIELEEKLETYEAERQNINSEYQKKYEKRIGEKSQQLEQDYNEKLKIETTRLEEKYKRQIIEKEKKEHELERQKKILINNQKQINEKQKEEIVKLLCRRDNISIDEMKQRLEIKNVPTERITDILKELKIQIPGMVKDITEDGSSFTYSIKSDAIKQLEEYKKWTVSPRISNVDDGTVEFIVRSDTHFNMTNSEDTIKKALFPCMEFCSKKGNIPIIDIGDLAETIKGINYTSWKNLDKDAIKLAYKFYRNYAKAINSAPEISHYTLFGNHDEHPYYAGVDPLEILLEYSNNFKSLGISNGSFKIGNDKIGVYHDKSWQNICFDISKDKRDEYIYDYLCDEVKNIAKDYIYSLIGHYHFGKHNPEQNFSVIGNGIENSLLFTAQVKDGKVEKMFVTELYSNGIQIIKSNYQTEIYNSGYALKK